MKPKVTIGVCVRNCEATIKEVIKSVLDQDFPHEFMEVIFVDDGSEDGTLSSILDCVPRVNMSLKVYPQKWKGIGAARSVVVDNARGKYILWVDDDMILPKDYVRKQVEFMERNPSVGIAKGKYELGYEGNLGAILENGARRLKYTDYNYEGKPHSSRPMGAGGCIYRTEAIRQVGSFDENIRSAGEDWDAEYRIRAGGWMLYITKVTFCHRASEITWKALWKKYFQTGYSLHYILHKHKGIERLPTMLPPAAFLSGLFRSLTVYKFTHRKIFFLLPLQFTFKMTAWCLGFIRSHLDSYGLKASRAILGRKK